jgi:drug/metabolite transporter (DMT)-like permease
MSERLRGTAEMSAAMLISGTIGWLVVVSGEPVAGVVLWRCVFGAATLALVCAAMGLLRRDILTRRVLLVAAAGGVAIVLNWLLLFASYAHASIAIATSVYNTQPFMLVGLGALLFGERITWTKIFWLCLAFLGMLLIVQAKPDAGYVGSDYLTGILLALGAAFFYALAAVAAKKLKGTPPHLIALIQVTVGVLMLAPLADWSDLPAGSESWLLLATLGIVHTGLMYILLYGAIQRLPTNLIGSLSFIYPVAAIVVDRVALGHHLHAVQILGAGAILFAAAGMNLGWTLPGRKAMAPR